LATFSDCWSGRIRKLPAGEIFKEEEEEEVGGSTIIRRNTGEGRDEVRGGKGVAGR
jgi:hypothetical protein